MNEIGYRIKQRREELQITQDELAKRMGYTSRSTINKVEKGINDVTQTNVVKYAQALDCTPAYLMGWEVRKPDEKTGELLIEVRKSPRLLHLVEYFMKLNPSQQESVLALIRSMTPDTHHEQ